MSKTFQIPFVQNRFNLFLRGLMLFSTHVYDMIAEHSDKDVHAEFFFDNVHVTVRKLTPADRQDKWEYRNYTI